MKVAVILVFAVVAVALDIGAPISINVDEVLRNSDPIDNYIKCALDKSKCTPEATTIQEEINSLLFEILHSNCATCTKDQILKLRKIERRMHEIDVKVFYAQLDKVDPTKELRIKYKETNTGLAIEDGFSDIFD